MSSPSKLLAELIHQHAVLRTMIDHCELLADQFDAGSALASALTREVTKLRITFDAHNAFEEQLLRPVLREADAFGQVHVDQMLQDHIDEHRAMRRHLDGPTSELRAVLYELRAHLVAEERHFLAASSSRSQPSP